RPFPHRLILLASSVFPLSFFFYCSRPLLALHSFPTRRSSDLIASSSSSPSAVIVILAPIGIPRDITPIIDFKLTDFFRYVMSIRSEEHTSELQSRFDLVCRLLLEKKNNKQTRRSKTGNKQTEV